MPGQQTKKGRDGLPVLVQGAWSRDKLYFVEYFEALFNGGMKNLWPTRAYVDLFSGPGMCIDRDTGEEFEGSPLLALGCSTPFTHHYFNDIDTELIGALEQRQQRLFPQAKVTYSNLDCNLAATSIAAQLPKGALTLAFIDPWAYEVTFDALASLLQGPHIDVIVTFHSTAIKRNVHQEVAAVDKFLDGTAWRERYWAAQGDLSTPPRVVLIDTLRARLRERLDYKFFGDPEVIRSTNGAPMYYMIFASHHPRGRDFWRKSSTRTRSGQRTMF